MRYYTVLLLAFGFSYNAMGASSSSTPGCFELKDPAAPKSHIPAFSPDLWPLARDVSRVLDPKQTFMAAAQQMAAIERSTPEGYRHWIHAAASTTPPTSPYPDDGLGIDDYGRPLKEAQESARQTYLIAARNAEETTRKAEAYRRKILYAAWQAAEARRKEEEDAAFYRRRMLATVDALLYEDQKAVAEKKRQLIYAAWLQAQHRFWPQ